MYLVVITNWSSSYILFNCSFFDLQDEEYNQMGLDCLRKAYELIESTDWKVEKVTPKGDTIHSTQRDKIGKIYKLTVC